MKKFNVITNFYCDRNPERQKEIDTCFKFNFNSKEIDRMIIFMNPEDSAYLDKILPSESHLLAINFILTDKRPTFNDFFKITEEYPDDVNAICNSDIIFNDPSVKTMKEFNWQKKMCFALCRWDLKKNEKGEVNFAEAVFYNHSDSQDAWLTWGAFPQMKGADFTAGTAGCDNVLAHLFLQNMNSIWAPSKNIVTFHYHITETRNYTDAEGVAMYRLPPPYHCLNPHYIEDVTF